MAPLVLERSPRERLADARTQATNPFPMSIDGQQALVVMSSSDFAEHCEPALTTEQRQMIREDYAAAMRGEVVDAREALAKIRTRYGV